MNKQNQKIRRPLIILLIPLLLCTSGCGEKSQPGNLPPVFSSPQVLVPEAPGKEMLGDSSLALDVSNMDQGYFTAQAKDTESKFNIQMTAPDGILYSYFLDAGEDAVIPFTGGSGSYQVTGYQQVEGSQYAALYCETLEVNLENDFFPYLYPNQYVSFTPESEAVKLAHSMMPDDTEDIEALELIFNYVTTHVTYDTVFADTVDAGYLPDVDHTLETGTGICFDYAALMTAMLRSRDIPCKLQIGYSGAVKHAWIDVYIQSVGWVDQAISFDGETWSRMDPTFYSNSDDKEDILSYIGEGTNYTVQFTR